jgi:hypothetical protein
MQQLTDTGGQGTSMSVTLSELFLTSEGQPVNYDGGLVYSMFEIPIEAGFHRWEFRLIKTSHSLVSGMNFQCKNGILEVEGIKTGQMTLWTDTSPKSVKFNLRSKKNCVLKLWNKWRYENVNHAWLGNSGMRVQTSKFCYRFECSQGFGEVDFSAFITELLLDGNP